MSLSKAVIFAALALAPGLATACACGCGMFQVGMPGLGLPTKSGGNVNLQMTFLDQDAAMQGSSKIPLSQSPDQRIRTTFYDLNTQYQFSRSWGMMMTVPYWQRSFDTDANFGNGPARIVEAKVNTLSDIRIMGLYTGFSPDMSSGLIFGMKLPTGTYNAPGFDRDTQPGTGSTDLLLGGYRLGQERRWGWFLQGMLRSAVSTRDDYRPGNSLHLVFGMHYDGFRYSSHITPMLQINATVRQADTGINSNTLNSGLKTLYLAPGALIDLGRHWQANANIYAPLYQHVNGIQLVPRQIASAGLTYNF